MIYTPPPPASPGTSRRTGRAPPCSPPGPTSAARLEQPPPRPRSCAPCCTHSRRRSPAASGRSGPGIGRTAGRTPTGRAARPRLRGVPAGSSHPGDSLRAHHRRRLGHRHPHLALLRALHGRPRSDATLGLLQPQALTGTHEDGLGHRRCRRAGGSISGRLPRPRELHDL